MARVVAALALLASASAFVPSSPLPACRAPRAAAATAPKMGMLDSMPGALPPLGVWDPCGLSTDIADSQILWYRAAELKHGRVAMLACAGWMVQGSGIAVLPGFLSKADNLKFADLGNKPIDAWDAIPTAGKIQIVLSCGLLEFHSEMVFDDKPHYTKGGPMPGNSNARWPWSGDPLGIMNTLDAEGQLARQNRELQNGRLAMIGTMGFSAASLIPGSVPALKGVGIFA